MRFVFDDETFSFELLRTTSYASYGGADIGECLMTAYRIQEGDFESWYEEWHATAKQIHDLADAALASGQQISAREAYLRATNYYRTAEFFLHGNPEDPRILSTWEKSRTMFMQACQLMDTPVEKVCIPYEGTNLTGYFYQVDNAHKSRPTLIIHGGYDSTGEELYFGGAAAAIQRGYNCLTFEGPGQGAVIREQHLPFRPDWEHVISPVVDYLLNRIEVDPERIALMGISFGGYLAPRAAAFEHRLAACIANDGIYSFQFSKMAGSIVEGYSDEEINNATPEELEGVVHELMQYNTGMRWAIENGLFTFKADTIFDLVEKTEQYTLEGIAEKIICPTLVCEAARDHFFSGQPRLVYDAIVSPKTYRIFTEAEGAEEHCHFGALKLFNHYLFEWLDKTLHTD